METDRPSEDEAGDEEVREGARLMALLQSLAEDLGRMGAAETLGVNYKTLATSLDADRLTRRMRDALVRLLLSGEIRAAAERQKRAAALERRVDALETEVRRVRRELAERTGLERESAQESSPTEADGGRGQLGTTLSPEERHSGVGPQVVTGEPVPGEEAVFGAAMPLIAEWRRLYGGGADAGDRLARAQAEERMRELEIEMLERWDLTLPPETAPLDGFTRGVQIGWRRKTLVRVRRERVRAQWRRWARRVLTLGL